jgi:hypothetical protein
MEDHPAFNACKYNSSSCAGQSMQQKLLYTQAGACTCVSKDVHAILAENYYYDMSGGSLQPKQVPFAAKIANILLRLRRRSLSILSPFPWWPGDDGVIGQSTRLAPWFAGVCVEEGLHILSVQRFYDVDCECSSGLQQSYIKLVFAAWTQQQQQQQSEDVCTCSMDSQSG